MIEIWTIDDGFAAERCRSSMVDGHRNGITIAVSAL
jgi:hypothetical protein